MLLLIAIANVTIYLWGQPTNGLSAHPTDGSTLDRVLAALTMMFVDGRIYPMFAFLFGYGMLQFTTSRLERGLHIDTVSRMLMRRHVWLMIFGAIHALLLFAGDVLGAYGLTGVLVASLLLRASDRTMRILLWTLGSVVGGMLILSAVGLLLLSLVLPADLSMFTTEEDLAGFDFAAFTTSDFMTGIESWWIAALVRIVVWIFSTPGAVLTLIVPLCVLLGGQAGRYRWLEHNGSKIRLAPVAIVGITLGALSGLPIALDHLGVVPQTDIALTGWFVLAQAFGIAAGAGYAALFALIGLRLGRLRGVTRWIAAVGQRSLTFYLFQSLIFAPLLSAWAFGLGTHLTTTSAFAIAAGVWILSVAIAAVLDRAGKRGPAEMLLRTLTYGKDAP